MHFTLVIQLVSFIEQFLSTDEKYERIEWKKTKRGKMLNKMATHELQQSGLINRQSLYTKNEVHCIKS